MQQIRDLLQAVDLDISVLGAAVLAAHGCPDALRADVWRVMLGYVPARRALRADVLGRQRAQYHKFVEEVTVQPGAVEEPEASGKVHARAAASAAERSDGASATRRSSALSLPAHGGAALSSISQADGASAARMASLLREDSRTLTPRQADAERTALTSNADALGDHAGTTAAGSPSRERMRLFSDAEEHSEAHTRLFADTVTQTHTDASDGVAAETAVAGDQQPASAQSGDAAPSGPLRVHAPEDASTVVCVLEEEAVADDPLSVLASRGKWAAWHADEELRAEIDKDIQRTAPGLHFFAIPANTAAMARILFVYAKLNSGVRYVQGMNELLVPLWYVFANESGPDTDMAAAEADTFFCFMALMAEVRDVFIKEHDNSATGVRGMLSRYGALLQRREPDVARHLAAMKLDHQYYAFRWITTLLSREFALPDVLMLWDLLLADDQRFELLLQACAAMLRLQRPVILKSDFGGCMRMLQHYPDVDFPQLLSAALAIRVEEQHDAASARVTPVAATPVPTPRAAPVATASVSTPSVGAAAQPSSAPPIRQVVAGASAVASSLFAAARAAFTVRMPPDPPVERPMTTFSPAPTEAGRSEPV